MSVRCSTIPVGQSDHAEWRRGSTLGVVADNEGKCCDAVLSMIEARLGITRANLRLPDQGDRTRRRIDLCAGLGSERYAFEHTRIEPFEGEMRTGVFFSKFVGPVQERLAGTLPGPARYDLLLPLDPTVAKRNDAIPKAQTALVDWVTAQAPALYEDAQSAPRLSALLEDSLPDLPYPVRLRCTALASRSSWSPTGQLLCSRLYDDQWLEEQRVERLRTALATKGPKLQCCKNRGAKTVLVLETDDMALTNSVIAKEALDKASEGRTDLPDEIYLVETDFDEWVVTPMNPVDCGLFRAGPDADVREFKQFDSANLRDVTRTSPGARNTGGVEGPCDACQG